MIPVNGKYTFISTATLSTGNTVIPTGTTHIVMSTAVTSDDYGILGFKPDGSTLQKLTLPTGSFLRLGNIIPGTSAVCTEATAPATTVTAITFYKWEKE